jgi:aerobic-type carbon monoxide dehydrogenase small subunit (CoxS/CutS family)
MPRPTIDVNGGKVAVIAPPDTPLLYLLRDGLGLHGRASVAAASTSRCSAPARC